LFLEEEIVQVFDEKFVFFYNYLELMEGFALGFEEVEVFLVVLD
jgi:hypothetical protein